MNSQSLWKEDKQEVGGFLALDARGGGGGTRKSYIERVCCRMNKLVLRPAIKPQCLEMGNESRFGYWMGLQNNSVASGLLPQIGDCFGDPPGLNFSEEDGTLARFILSERETETNTGEMD